VTEPLQDTLVEIERHVGQAGWDQPPQLFALAETADLLAREPALAASLGMIANGVPAGALTPVEQDPLPDAPLDESLAQIGWPPEVAGCALVQEVVMLPPDAEDAMPQSDVLTWAADHPDRRDARLAVAVLRDGTRACTVRLRGAPEEAELLVGADLAPNLAAALLATLTAS